MKHIKIKTTKIVIGIILGLIFYTKARADPVEKGQISYFSPFVDGNCLIIPTGTGFKNIGNPPIPSSSYRFSILNSGGGLVQRTGAFSLPRLDSGEESFDQRGWSYCFEAPVNNYQTCVKWRRGKGLGRDLDSKCVTFSAVPILGRIGSFIFLLGAFGQGIYLSCKRKVSVWD